MNVIFFLLRQNRNLLAQCEQVTHIFINTVSSKCDNVVCIGDLHLPQGHY